PGPPGGRGGRRDAEITGGEGGQLLPERKADSSSSSERPLVSGTKRCANPMEARPSTANMKNVAVMPNPATRDGKVSPTEKLASHSTHPASPKANPRIRIGKISESSSQVTGETKPCWKTRNRPMHPR